MNDPLNPEIETNPGDSSISRPEQETSSQPGYTTSPLTPDAGPASPGSSAHGDERSAEPSTAEDFAPQPTAADEPSSAVNWRGSDATASSAPHARADEQALRSSAGRTRMQHLGSHRPSSRQSMSRDCPTAKQTSRHSATRQLPGRRLPGRRLLGRRLPGRRLPGVVGEGPGRAAATPETDSGPAGRSRAVHHGRAPGRRGSVQCRVGDQRSGPCRPAGSARRRAVRRRCSPPSRPRPARRLPRLYRSRRDRPRDASRSRQSNRRIDILPHRQAGEALY